MSKAILVIDMPKSCKECNIQYEDEYSYWCPCNHVKENTTDIYDHVINLTKPDWCPLKELPEKYDIRDSNFEYESGYNACIDKILEEKIL
jgi:hypothetical protein